MHILEVMSHPVITCPVQAQLDQAARLMWEFDCGTIPVLDDDGRLAGIVTDRDICMAAYTQGKPLHEIPVTTAMARSVIAVYEHDSVEAVERLMQENQIRRLPVLDAEGHPTGIVSLNDLARLAAQTHRGGVDRELVTTLAAICQPRAVDPTREAHAILVATS
jgi:CBS domain-containing protein